MSLWGTGELYTEGAICNARLAPVIYPGWTMRVYCSPEVPVLERLRSLGVDVRIVSAAPGHAGLFWRFLPAGENEFEHVIVRDADSRVNVREKAAVDAWIASGLPFHVMRDHAFHRNAPMLAGMWGCRGGSIPDIQQRIARFERGAEKHADTIFLREDIWPRVKSRCLVHSSVPEPLGGDAFPPHAPFDGFVGEIVDPRAEAKGVIAILLPSRGRPVAALATAESARDTAAAPDECRVIVGVEPDEADEYRRVFGAAASWLHVLQSGGSYVRAMRELHRSTIAGIYGLVADDFLFETSGWDARVRAAVADLPERLGLVHGDDAIQWDRLATAPFLTAEWIACVANILPGDYEHMFSDTEVTEIARLAGLLRFLPDVKITHRHYLVGDAVLDSTYARASATMAAGRAEFERREDERQRLASRLMTESRAPVLSVLVQGVVQRAGPLDELLAGLHRQREALPDPSVVEILAEADAGERSSGAKRKHLLTRARGKWVAFIEDDDAVADDSAAVILQALEQNPDCVTLGRPAPSDVFASPTSHRIFAVRRSIALAATRKRDVIGREAFKWSGSLAPFLKSEVTIDQNVFHHRFGSMAESDMRAPGAARTSHQGPSRSHSIPGLPSPACQLLLAAAFCRDDVARRAWNAWVSEVGVGLADPASMRLFPLVWWRLERLGVTGIEVNALKPYYWDSWATSHARVQLAAEMMGTFDRAGIPTLLLKGIALASCHYEQPALRPMGDLDLMVPAAFANEARRVLNSAGWRPMENAPESALGLLHGLGFADREGRFLDLHWHALHESSWPSADEGFWDRAETVDIGGTSARVLAPADQLLHVCVHGLRWAKVPAIQWVPDVMAILNSAGGRVDWDLLIAEAQARRVVMQVRTALDHVRVAFGVAALEPVCERLGSLRCTLIDGIDFHVRVSAPSLRRNLLLFWLDHVRLHAEDRWPSRYLGFPRYLRRMWGLRSLMEVPGAAARKGTRRLRERPRV